MKNVNLYNQDGSLHPEAQFLLSSKPDDISRGEWIKLVRKFKSSLSAEDLKEFKKLKKRINFNSLRKLFKLYFKKRNFIVFMEKCRLRKPSVKPSKEGASCIFIIEEANADPRENFFEQVRLNCSTIC